MLGEGPLRQRRRLGARCVEEADLGVAVLELFHDLLGHLAAAGNVGEIIGHFAEHVRRAVGEKEDGSVGGRRLSEGHAVVFHANRRWGGWGCDLMYAGGCAAVFVVGSVAAEMVRFWAVGSA